MFVMLNIGVFVYYVVNGKVKFFKVLIFRWFDKFMIDNVFIIDIVYMYNDCNVVFVKFSISVNFIMVCSIIVFVFCKLFYEVFCYMF